MGLLVKPATYLSLAAFKAQANDQAFIAADGTPYSDDQLTDLLVRASAKVDGICNRSYLPREVTEQFVGNGTDRLMIWQYPIIYVKAAQLVMPGFAPYALPIGDLMIDYETGQVRSWSPMIFRSLGVANVFPRDGLPIVITYAYGYGYPIPPPSFSLTNGVAGYLTVGATVNIAVTTRTQSGESLPSPAQSVVVAASGGIGVDITPQPGAYVYRVYASIGANTTQQIAAAADASSFTPVSMAGIAAGDWLTFGFGTANCEDLQVAGVAGAVFTTTKPAQFAHAIADPIVARMQLVAESPATNFGLATMVVAVQQLTSPVDYGLVYAPLVDSSAWELPNEFIEATRLLALSTIWEQNNLANRGVYSVGEGTDKITFRSTEGNSGRGVPLAEQEAVGLLGGYVLGGLLC